MVKVVSYTVVDDFGNLINPMLAEGQVHGGVGKELDKQYMSVLSMMKMANYSPRHLWITLCLVPRIYHFTNLIQSGSFHC